MSIDRTGGEDSKQLLGAVAFGVVVYCCVYALQCALRLPGLIYPVAHTWLLGGAPAGVQMRYYNNLGSAAAAGVAMSILRLRRRGAAVNGLVSALQEP